MIRGTLREATRDSGVPGTRFVRVGVEVGQASKCPGTLFGREPKEIFRARCGTICLGRNRKSRGPPCRRTPVKPRARARVGGDQLQE